MDDYKKFIASLFVFLIPLVGVIASQFLKLTSPQTVILGGSILVASIIAFGITWLIIQMTRTTQHDWLWKDVDLLIEVEGKAKGSDVWVVSPHLLNDTGTQYVQTTIATIQKNAERGIIYTYIVPDTNEIRKLLPHLESNFSKTINQLKVIRLHPATFQNLTRTEVAIYNPKMVDGQAPQAYMQLPVNPSYTYWAKVTDDMSFEFVERIAKIIEENVIE